MVWQVCITELRLSPYVVIHSWFPNMDFFFDMPDSFLQLVQAGIGDFERQLRNHFNIVYAIPPNYVYDGLIVCIHTM